MNHHAEQEHRRRAGVVPFLALISLAAAGWAVAAAAARPPGGAVDGTPTTVRRQFRPTDEVFPNPERGFYRAVNLLRAPDLGRVRKGGYRLVFSYIRLDEARDGPIPDSILTTAERGLEAARAAGVKAILRCAYNNGPYPNPEPDAPKERVLEHIRQLRPLFRRNEDVIAVVQAGFVGAWGEWHSSTNRLLDDPRDYRQILEALMDALPPARMVQLRNPRYKRALYGEALTEQQALRGSYAGRLGHHNDCFLANETDMGTYPRGQEEAWKAYLAQETRFLPMGGETCAVFPTRTDCGPAMAEMKRLHFTYLNQDYHRRVVAGWSEQGCRAEIDRKLGYRLALVDAEIPVRLRPGSRFRLRVRLRNDGWAAPINPRPVFAVLDGSEGRHTFPLPVRDVRHWEAGREVVIDGQLPLPASARPGRYRLALWLPDAAVRLRPRPEYAIRLANDGVWDEKSGWNVLADVTVAR
jgi:hypothetical protein